MGLRVSNCGLVREALGNVLRLPNVETAGRFALEDVEVIHRYEFGGADGVRTHDLPGFTGTRSATFQSFGDVSMI